MALNRDAIRELLEKLDASLTDPATICLIGSSATILLGQEARQTEDVDVWARASIVKVRELEAACEAAGLTFDPKDEFPDVPYLQMVHPGIVQVPGWNAERREWFGEPERVVWQGERLTVTVPPPRAIAASKLVRGEPQDLQDCLWLMAAHGVEAQAIMEAIRALPRKEREKALDNMEILNLMKP